MKITNMTYEIFRRAAHRWSIDNDVSLERVEHYGRDEILELAINWSALGARTVDETHGFIASLRVAAAVVEEVNRYEFEVVPGNDPRFDGQSIFDFVPAETAKVYEMFRIGKIGQIGRWFEAGRIA